MSKTIRLSSRGLHGEYISNLTTTGRWRIYKGIDYCGLSLECTYKTQEKLPTPWWQRQKYHTVVKTSWFDEDNLQISVYEEFTNECAGGCDA